MADIWVIISQVLLYQNVINVTCNFESDLMLRSGKTNYLYADFTTEAYGGETIMLS